MTAPDVGRPVADGLWTATADGPRLVGARCPGCGTVTFPVQRSCPRCTAEGMTDHVLPPRGTLWSFTVQGFRPKTPYLDQDGEFTPYGVGYVDLGDVLVEARLTEPDPERLRIGMPVHLEIVPFHADPDGTPVTVFAFAPDEQEGPA